MQWTREDGTTLLIGAKRGRVTAIEAIRNWIRIAGTIPGCHQLSPSKEKWPTEDYAKNAIIRLRETPKLKKNISKFCRVIAEEEGIPEIAASLKKLLYEPEYKKLWRP